MLGALYVFLRKARSTGSRGFVEWMFNEFAMWNGRGAYGILGLTRGTTILLQFKIDAWFGKGNFFHNLVIWGKFQRYEQYEGIPVELFCFQATRQVHRIDLFICIYNIYSFFRFDHVSIWTVFCSAGTCRRNSMNKKTPTIQVHLNDILENMKYYQTKELGNVRFVWCSCLCLIGPLTPYESFRFPPNPVAQQSERLKDWWPSSFSRLCKMSTWHLHMTSFQNAQCMMYLRVTFIYPSNYPTCW